MKQDCYLQVYEHSMALTKQCNNQIDTDKALYFDCLSSSYIVAHSEH
jgi:hypothetical protein